MPMAATADRQSRTSSRSPQTELAEGLSDRELTHLSRVTTLGELSGSLAHELNQPLTAILSNAQAALRMMQQDADSREEIEEILSEIVAESLRASQVIHRMRDLLKKGEVHFEVLDLGAIVADVVRLLRSDLVLRGVSVSTDIPPRLPRIRGDRIQLEQVLVNLVTNACDAMTGTPDGDRLLALRASNGRDRVCVSVTDNGCGMTAAELDRLFQPFVTSKANGLGLGLAVSRTIIAAHGGRLSASNNPRRGATFRFTLPTYP
jgi:two-component system, LuxR family, sensor kinase FixL